MSSITEPEADLVELARRLRTVAKALKRLPADHAASSEKMEDLRSELKAIAARLRRIH